jgi:ABC-2 type transport system ATP-binding protein
VLTVTDLGKRYAQRTAVDGVTFSINPGEIVGLLGPNGAGKSTTIECILGLRRPDRGVIRVGTCDAIRDRRAAAQLIGAQLQATALQDTITAREAVTLFRSFYATGAEPSAVIRATGIETFADRRFATLSQGERQRVALALALINDPRLLILDEPTAGMDPHARRLMHDLIRQQASQGTAILLATQIIEEAQRLCDRVVVIDHGRIIAEGKPQELIAHSGLPAQVIVRTTRPLDLTRWPGANAAHEPTASTTTIATLDPTQVLAELLPAIAANGDTLLAISLERPTLEDVFLARTGRRIA